ncbi:MAG: hypothetical protein SWX82_20930 [Cyanobacteriota bacterium]|nr:hypothetical protein [Cyanobacteriota bacterium]
MTEFKTAIASLDNVENIATQHLINPGTLQLPTFCPTLTDILRTRNIFHH